MYNCNELQCDSSLKTTEMFHSMLRDYWLTERKKHPVVKACSSYPQKYSLGVHNEPIKYSNGKQNQVYLTPCFQILKPAYIDHFGDEVSIF